MLLSAGVACTQLFADPKQNTLDGRQPPTGMAPLQPNGMPEVPGGICTTGQMRCEGALLQTCSDDLQSWVTVQRCGAAALCQVAPTATCLAATCAVDEMTCAGAVLQRCNEDRTGWDVFNTCLSPAHCNANMRACLTEPCQAGDRRCDRSQADQSPVLEVCRDDRSGWDRLDSCVTRELCDQTLTSTGLGGLVVGSDGMVGVQPGTDPSTVVQCILPACAAGETRCEGTLLQFCSEGRTGWITAEECASDALCQGSRTNLSTSGTPTCLPPACAVGQHRCSETGMLQVCSDDRSGFVDKEQCIGAPFCNAALAEQGQSGCTDAPCEAGLMQCNGPQIQICREDRTGLDPVGEPCESAALCNADDPTNAFCDEPLCRRGATSGDEFRCEGAQLQRCNESLTVYDQFQTCVTAELCDASLRQDGCRPPECAPGQFNCSDDGFLQVCNAGRTDFDNVENCGSRAQCDESAGRCADPCEPGAVRCNASNGDLERCNDRLTGWQPIADCPNAQLCDAENQRCRICVPNEFSCADGQLRQCDDEGRTFARQNIPPECALDPATGGGGIRACSQNNQVVINPCPLGCSQNRCHECFEGQTQCVGNGQIRSCVNGFFGPPTNCSDGNFCNGTETCANNQCVGGAPPGCNGFGCQLNRCNNCNGGQCSGAQFMTCNNGLLSTPANCPQNQTCQGGGNCVFNCAALNCNDNNPCTNDTCTAQAGCGRTNVPNGTSCSDGNACDGNETCQNGNCANGAAPNCNDGNPCTTDGCNPATGCTRNNVANGTACGDANACNGSETCQNGSCNNPPDVVCAAPPACRTVSCNSTTGACTQGNAANGTACTAAGGVAGTCTAGTCNPTQVCTAGQRRCNGATVQICNAARTGFVNDTNACNGSTRISCTNGQLTNFACPGAVCREPVCSAGACTTQADTGGACTISGAAGTCNAAGTCVSNCTDRCEGNVFVDCAANGTSTRTTCLRQFGECVRGTCSATGCAPISNEPAGTPCSGGRECNGQGACVAPAPPPPTCTRTCRGNVFVDCVGGDEVETVCLHAFGECRRDTCTLNGCAQLTGSFEPAGTPCSGNRTCNGSGTCGLVVPR